MTFVRWLGQNSKQGKLTRQLIDIQARMRVKVSGDRTDIRQSYLPAMFPHIVQPLMDQGAVSHMHYWYIAYLKELVRALSTRSLNGWTSISSQKRTGTLSWSSAWTIIKMISY